MTWRTGGDKTSNFFILGFKQYVCVCARSCKTKNILKNYNKEDSSKRNMIVVYKLNNFRKFLQKKKRNQKIDSPKDKN